MYHQQYKIKCNKNTTCLIYCDSSIGIDCSFVYGNGNVVFKSLNQTRHVQVTIAI